MLQSVPILRRVFAAVVMTVATLCGEGNTVLAEGRSASSVAELRADITPRYEKRKRGTLDQSSTLDALSRVEVLHACVAKAVIASEAIHWDEPVLDAWSVISVVVANNAPCSGLKSGQHIPAAHGDAVRARAPPAQSLI